MTPVVYLSDGIWPTARSRGRCPSLETLPDIAGPQRDATATGHLPAVRARPETPRPAVGRPRHAGPRAPHRRPREGRRHRQRQLRPGEPPQDDAASARRRSPASRNDIPPLDVVRPRVGRAAGRRLGLHLRRDRSAVERAQAAASRVAHAHLRHLNPLPANTGEVLRATAGAGARRSTSGSCRCSCGPLPHRRGGLQRSGAAVPDPGDRSTRPSASSAGGAGA